METNSNHWSMTHIDSSGEGRKITYILLVEDITWLVSHEPWFISLGASSHGPFYFSDFIDLPLEKSCMVIKYVVNRPQKFASPWDYRQFVLEEVIDDPSLSTYFSYLYNVILSSWLQVGCPITSVEL